MSPSEWKTERHARRYLDRADRYPRRAEGERALLELVPARARRMLDLGTGDGRLIELLGGGRRDLECVGLDFSEIMLSAARERLDGDGRAQLLEHDLAEPLPALGRFDVIVSSFAIHHLVHERKRSLYGEAFEMLNPGGLFGNLEHVASPSHRLHLEFFVAIGEPLEDEDPSDRLLDVHTQLEWLSGSGFEDVDCYWKWREMALLAAFRPPRE